MSGGTQETAGRDRLVAVVRRLGGAVRRRCEIDARALAAFRISLGALILTDLALRSRNLVAFYTDAGVLPREALFSDYGQVYSIHALWGDAWIQAVLFLIAGLFGLAVLVGYRTRLATFVSWLFLLSLHVRNPMVLNGGDVLFRMLLFWGMFIPLGERWSVDAAQRDGARSTIASVATAALLLQMVLLYVTNAAHKLRGEQWLGGEAISYVFSLDQFTVLLGNYIAEFHPLLRVLTYVWVTLIVLSPLLVLGTGWIRVLLASAIAGMHLGMLVTMKIGIFPLVVVAGLLPFYPAFVWDRVAAVSERFGVAQPLQRWRWKLATLLPGGVPVASDGGSETEPESTSGASADRAVRPENSPDDAGRETSFADVLSGVVASAVPLFFLVLVVFSNAQAIGVARVPDQGQQVLEVTETDQHWRMFAPDPLGTDGWLVAAGELENGSKRNVWTDSALTWDRPPNIDAIYPSARWRKYVRNVWSAGNRNHESYFAHYLCGHWNRTHETDLKSVGLYYMTQPSRPYNETEPIAKNFMHEHDCSGDLTQ